MFLLFLVTMHFPPRTSLMYILFPMNEAESQKRLSSASGEQHRHADTKHDIALSSENAVGDWWCHTHASRQESLYSRKFITV